MRLQARGDDLGAACGLSHGSNISIHQSARNISAHGRGGTRRHGREVPAVRFPLCAGLCHGLAMRFHDLCKYRLQSHSSRRKHWSWGLAPLATESGNGNSFRQSRRGYPPSSKDGLVKFRECPERRRLLAFQRRDLSRDDSDSPGRRNGLRSRLRNLAQWRGLAPRFLPRHEESRQWPSPKR